MSAPVRLVEAVVERGREELLRARGERGAEERRAADREDGVREAGPASGSAGPGLCRRHGRLGDERDRDGRHARRRRGGSAPSQVRHTPPARAAARLSAWPSSRTPSREERTRGRARGRRRCAPATRPSAITAALEPSPRSRGIRSKNSKRSPSAGSMRSNAWTPRCDRSGVPPSETISSSFQRSSATAAQSKPAPRLAVVAGARTESFTLPPPRSRRGPVGPRWAGSERRAAASGSLRPWPVITQTTRAPRSGRSRDERGEAGRGRRLAEDALELGEIAPGSEDLLVGERNDRAARARDRRLGLARGGRARRCGSPSPSCRPVRRPRRRANGGRPPRRPRRSRVRRRACCRRRRTGARARRARRRAPRRSRTRPSSGPRGGTG